MKSLIATSFFAIGMMTMHAKDATLSCRLVFVPQHESTPSEFFLDGGRRGAAFRVVPSQSLDSPAVTIPLPKSGILRFCDGEGSKANLIGEVKVPAGAAELLVFVLPDIKKADEKQEDRKSCRFVAFDARPKSLKGGGLVLHNGGNSEARVSVGEKTQTIPAGTNIVVGSPEPKDSYNMVPVTVEVNDGRQWRKLKEGSSRFVADMVYWMVVFEEPQVQRPQLQIYKDR